MYYYKHTTKIGDLYYLADDHHLLSISFEKNENFKYKENVIIEDVKTQINEYLDQTRTTFDLPLKVLGSDFEVSVYDEMSKIPYGELLTYKQLGHNIHREKAYRAVGSACNKNKYPIVIPCHRVVGSNHKLTGYAGGLDMKKQLLQLEGIIVTNDMITSNCQ